MLWLRDILTQCCKQVNTIHTYSSGTFGGLFILWNPTTLILEVFLITKWTISTDYKAIGLDKDGLITNVYRPLIQPNKKRFLLILKGLGNIAKGHHWILGGEFNMIISLEEKRGVIRQQEHDSEEFKDTTKEMGLIDIENSNGEFRWTNRMLGSQHIACILDRFLVSKTLIMDVLSMEDSVLEISSSDHWPIQLWMDIASSPKKNPFQFEIFWLTHPEFQ